MYLDSTATTKPTDFALSCFDEINTKNWHNPSSTSSEYGIAAKRIINTSRSIIAKCLETTDDKIIFTSGSTEGANTIIKGFVPRGHEKNYGIICSPIEHPAIWEPVNYMKECGVDVKFLDVDKHGIIDLHQLKNYLEGFENKNGVLVCVMDSNNEIGTIQDTRKISDIVHSYPGAYLFSDMTQSFAHADKYTVKDLGYDFAIGSAHKFCGLKGTGFIYADNIGILTPLLHGGGQEFGFRSGTENVGGIYSMAMQFEQICNTKRHKDNEYINNMKNKIIFRLVETIGKDNFHVNTPSDGLANILNITIYGHDANQIISLLDLQDYQVSAGSACHTGENKPSRILKSIGLSDEDARSTLRISISSDMSFDDIKKFIISLRRIVNEQLGV